jgi:hypothetical protein
VVLYCSLLVLSANATSGPRIRLVKSVDELSAATSPVGRSVLTSSVKSIHISEESMKKIFENESNQLKLTATSMKATRELTSGHQNLTGTHHICFQFF